MSGTCRKQSLLNVNDLSCLLSRKNPLITGKEMSETLSVTQHTIERDLAAMQKAGIIRHEGKVYAGVWVVLEKPQKKD